MTQEQYFLDYLSRGGRLGAPSNAPPRYRAELMRLMSIFVDSEMAGASGFADCINLAPGLKGRATAARIVLEKFEHARLVFDLMEQFGANIGKYVGVHNWSARLERDADLGTRRVDGDMRLNVFHYPIHGWVDAVVMNFLMGRATEIQIDDLTRCSYEPLADAMASILEGESHHADAGEEGLRAALRRGHDRAGIQASVNYWYPRVLESFGRAVSDHFEAARLFGLRQRSNAELSASWEARVGTALGDMGLALPQ